jgi:hypothetical protein
MKRPIPIIAITMVYETAFLNAPSLTKIKQIPPNIATTYPMIANISYLLILK